MMSGILAFTNMIGACLQFSILCITSTIMSSPFLRGVISHAACSLIGWVAFHSKVEQNEVQHRCICECHDSAQVMHGPSHVEAHMSMLDARSTDHLPLSVSDSGDSHNLISNSSGIPESSFLPSASWGLDGILLVATFCKWWVARPTMR